MGNDKVSFIVELHAAVRAAFVLLLLLFLFLFLFLFCCVVFLLFVVTDIIAILFVVFFSFSARIKAH